MGYPGSVNLQISWKYEPTLKVDNLPYRTLRTSFILNSIPSLDINTRILVSPQSEKFLLKAVNLQNQKKIALKDLIIVQSNGCNGNDCGLTNASVLNLGIESTPGSPLSLYLDTEAAVEEDLSSSFNEPAIFFVRGFIRQHQKSGQMNGQQICIIRWEIRDGDSSSKYRNGLIISPCDKRGVSERVAAHLQLDAYRKHRFSSGPCNVDAKLLVKSSLSHPVDVLWNFGARIEDRLVHLPPGDSKLCATFEADQNPAAWCGKISGTIQDLKTDEQREVDVRAVVYQPGVTKLEGACITWYCKSNPQVVGSLAIEPCFVSINEADSTSE